MAVTQGRTWSAGTTVADAAVTVAFCTEEGRRKYNPTGTQTDGGSAKVLSFDVDSSSAAPLLVNIPAIHGLTYYYPIAAGKSKDFLTIYDGTHAGTGDFARVKGGGGVATFTGGVSG